MYSLRSEPFGENLKHTFFNDQSGNSFSIVPALGASVLNIEINGVSIIDGCQSYLELLENKWFKSSLLIPFPNRLKNGQYTFEGKAYYFPINEPATKNTLHGFGTNQPFDLISTSCDQNFAAIHCRHQNKGSDQAYPFAFQFDVKLRIAEPHFFEVEFIFQNENKGNLPVGLGWHPYFNCFENLNESVLQMPDCQVVELGGDAIPNGERIDYNYFEKGKKIGNTVLDNAFALNGKEGKASVILKSGKGKLTYWQETGARKFNFLQVFTPSDRKSIAIEPMTCNIDAFNNGEGLIVLKEGEQFSAKCGFSFEAE